MAALTPALVVGGAIVASSVVGGVMANKQASKYGAMAQAASARAVAELRSVGVPDIEAQKIVLQNPQLIFKFAPELEQYYELGKSKMEDVSVDPRLRDAQMNALAKLQEVGDTGLTPEDKANLNQIRRSSAQQAKAGDESILQNMQARGMGGSGQELALRGISNQQAMQNASQQGDQLAATAYKRALDAIAQSGQMGTSMEAQQFGEQSQVAQAQDAISKFNVANRQDVQQRNIGSKNAAENQLQVLKQGLEEKRVDTANQQEIHNKELIQQDFENKLQKAMAVANAETGQASMYNAQGKAKAANTAAIGQNVSSGIGNMYAMGAFKGAGSSADKGTVITNDNKTSYKDVS
jgi:hypothetical protein